jgi:hypothetical protein
MMGVRERRIKFVAPSRSLSASQDDASSVQEVRQMQNIRSNKTK